ncbi:MAG: DNA cytosine methyltransferase [Rhodothermaceae bacterium]|nr:DNA cytosine methyltransferase [Rhodothermaceae bacterium]MYD66864.1 DNA cytosine methyltransferase [Rhodothermaceae bacterium]MYI78141.1 DNA cytosine methyltransferase [Gammaproteobacteria bacterium]
MPKSSQEKRLILSLFSGCGGLDLGFEQAGYRIGLAYDLSPSAIASHNYNRDKNSAFVRDVTQIKLSDLDKDFGEKFHPCGVIGGPPCQSFSRGNSSKKANDPRTKLVRSFFNLALKVHRNRGGLDFIVMENVPEIMKADGGRLLQKEIDRLEAAGFTVPCHVYDAVNYGVPQTRKRLFLIALNESRYSGVWDKPRKVHKIKVVGDVISGLTEPVHYIHSKSLQNYPEHPNHWCMTPRSEKFFDASLTPGRSTGRSFKTLAWDKPSYTASYGHREVHVHPDCNRRLSVFEAMLIQGFPRSYSLLGTLSSQISQVSEAVPPPLAKAIAHSVDGAVLMYSDANSLRAAA